MKNAFTFGLIGATSRGVWLAKDLDRQKEATLVAGADPTPQGKHRLREMMGRDVPFHEDYRRMLDDSAVDAVIVASPDNFHEEQAVAALKAGKHLFLEKPMTISTEGCRRVIEQWRRTNCRLMIGFNMRSMPLFHRMRSLIQKGQIGDVELCWARYFVGRGPNFYFQNWRAKREGVNSLLLQKASHDLDMIQFLTDTRPTRLAAFGSRHVFGGDRPNDLHCEDCPDRALCTYSQNILPAPEHSLCAFRKEIDIEDAEMVIMQMESGIEASYQQCMFAPIYQREYCVIGNKGCVQTDYHANLLHIWYTSHWRLARKPDETIDVNAEIHGGHGGGDSIMIRQFVEYMLEDKPPPAGPYDGYWSVATGCAAAESLRDGGTPQNVVAPPSDDARIHKAGNDEVFVYED